MKQTAKAVSVTVISVIIMCLVTVLMILYAEGYFDISFINRPEDVTYTEETEAPSGETGSTEETGEQTGDETEGTTDEETKPLPEETFEYLTEIPDGYGISTDDYSSNDTVIVKLGSEETDRYKGKYYRVSYTNTFGQNGKVFFRTVSTVMAPAVHTYMDYIVHSYDDKLVFSDAKGNILYTHERKYEDSVMNAFDDEGNIIELTVKVEVPLVYAYQRDNEGSPLFIEKDVYYKIADGALTEVDMSEQYDRGLYFSYPKSFGVKEGEYTVSNVRGKFAIYDENGRRVRSAIYEEAYNYSEGLGMVIHNGEMFYLNENLKIAVREGYLPVGDRDEDGIGGLYYEYGYVRVRKLSIYKGEIREDIDVIIDTAGNEFDLPAGHTLVALSDGRILLKDDHTGKYGFYSLKEAWITDTVFNKAEAYYEGLARVNYNGSEGMIDKNGEYVIPPVYTEVRSVSNGIIVCYDEDKGVYDIFAKCNPLPETPAETAEPTE